jgi:hypothetical protein
MCVDRYAGCETRVIVRLESALPHVATILGTLSVSHAKEHDGPCILYEVTIAVLTLAVTA